MHATINECTNDLIRVYNKLDHDLGRMLSLAPVFLVSCSEYSDNLHDQMEGLAKTLEEQEIFRPSTTEYMELFFHDDSYVKQEPVFMQKDERHTCTFRTWMQQLTYSGSVKNGIVSLFLSEEALSRQFDSLYRSIFRQMEGYKNRFLFFLFVPREKSDEFEKLLSKSMFCSRIAYTEPSEEAYFAYFTKKLSENGIASDQDTNELLLAILKRERMHLTMSAIDRAVREITWQMLLSEKKSLIDILHAGTLEKYTLPQTEQKRSSIGFTHEEKGL